MAGVQFSEYNVQGLFFRLVCRSDRLGGSAPKRARLSLPRLSSTASGGKECSLSPGSLYPGAFDPGTSPSCCLGQWADEKCTHDVIRKSYLPGLPILSCPRAAVRNTAQPISGPIDTMLTSSFLRRPEEALQEWICLCQRVSKSSCARP